MTTFTGTPGSRPARGRGDAQGGGEDEEGGGAARRRRGSASRRA